MGGRKMYLVVITIVAVMLSGCLTIGITSYSAAHSAMGNADQVRLKLVGRIGGPTIPAVVQGDYAYVGHSYEFAVVDISDPAAPARVGYVSLSTNDIVVDDRHAYVAGRDGFAIIDLADPAQPQIKAQYSTPSGMAHVAIANGYAYLVGAKAGLWVFDVRSPENPLLAGVKQIDAKLEDMMIAGGHLYLAADDGFYVLALNEPNDPALLAHLAQTGRAHALTIAGSYAYIATSGGLAVVDISRSSKPVLLSFLALPGYLADVAVVGTVAYVSAGGSGLYVLDISNPARPTKRDTSSWPGLAHHLASREGRLYLTDLDGGLHILEVTDPQHPEVVGKYQAPGAVLDVQTSGDYVLVTSGWQGARRVTFLSAEDSEQMRPVYTHELGNATWRLARDNTHLYVLDAAGNLDMVSVADLADKSSTQVRSTWPEMVEFEYLVDPFGALATIDIGQPHSPVLSPSPSLAAGLHDLVVGDETLYAAAGQHGLYVQDLKTQGDADSDQPALSDLIVLRGYARAVVTQNEYVYVATKQGDLHIVHAPNAENVDPVNTIRLSGTVYDMFLLENYLFVALGEDGVAVLDLSIPTRPHLLEILPMQHAAMAVAATNERLYVGSHLAGLLVYRHEYAETPKPLTAAYE